MRRVIQKTVTTTRIISLTITHSDEAVEYSLTTSADQSNNPEPPLLERSAADGVIDAPPERDDGEPTPLERSAADGVIDMPSERDDGEPMSFERSATDEVIDAPSEHDDDEPTPFNPADEAGAND